MDVVHPAVNSGPERLALRRGDGSSIACHLSPSIFNCMGIVEAAVAGEAVESEVEAVYRSDGDRLWHALCTYTGDEDIASDAVAEAFAQAVGRGSAIRDVQAWVWRVAYRLAATELRKRSKTVHGQLPARSVVDIHPDAELADALAALTPQQRIAVILFYYADCPVREIARRTGMNAISVRAHLSRGRRRLRAILGDAR